MNTNEYQRAEGALRTLEGLGFDVKALWREAGERANAWETAQPTPEELRYLCPTQAPATVDHFEGGRPEVLRCETMWPGYSYRLSPGQRRWFRDFTGMTPAQTVTIAWVEYWPKTACPRAFKVVSDVHVDPRLRRQMLTEWVVRSPAEFFGKSLEFDRAMEEERTLKFVLGDVNVWRSEHRRAVEELTQIRLKGSAGEIEITSLTEEHVQFSDPYGRVATVRKDDFLEAVAEWVARRGEEGMKTVRTTKTKPSVPSIDALMSELEGGLQA